MRGYTCDQCGKTHGSNWAPTVVLAGVSRKSGILLAPVACEFTFCTALCFWAWIVEQMPDNLVIPAELRTR